MDILNIFNNISNIPAIIHINLIHSINPLSNLNAFIQFITIIYNFVILIHYYFIHFIKLFYLHLLPYPQYIFSPLWMVVAKLIFLWTSYSFSDIISEGSLDFYSMIAYPQFQSHLNLANQSISQNHFCWIQVSNYASI